MDDYNSTSSFAEIFTSPLYPEENKIVIQDKLKCFLSLFCMFVCLFVFVFVFSFFAFVLL